MAVEKDELSCEWIILRVKWRVQGFDQTCMRQKTYEVYALWRHCSEWFTMCNQLSVGREAVSDHKWCGKPTTSTNDKMPIKFQMHSSLQL